jgi:hypothetical protein
MTDIAPAPAPSAEPAAPPAAAPVATPAQPAAPAPAAPSQPAAPNQGFVDLSGIQDPTVREQLEKRFAYFKYDSRSKDEALRQLGQHNAMLERRLTDIEVGRQKEQAQTQLANLRSQHTEALQRGEYDKATLVTEQIARLSSQPQPAPRPAPTQQTGMSPDEVKAVQNWAQARDAGGNALRPWAQPSHEKYADGIRVLSEVSNDPLFVNAPTATLLHEVERRMASVSAPAPVRQAPGAAPVLGGGNARPPASTERNLTEDEKRVAVNMFVRSGRVKNADEAHALYRKQIGLGR